MSHYHIKSDQIGNMKEALHEMDLLKEAFPQSGYHVVIHDDDHEQEEEEIA